MLTGALLHVGVSAQTSGNGQASVQGQAASQTSKGSSPELLEAEKLNIEVVKLSTTGKYDSAITLARRVLQIREKALAPGHELINSALRNLAELYISKRDYGEAEDYYQRILSNYEKMAAPAPAVMAKVLDRLALLSYTRSNFNQAEKFYQRALALREQAQGAERLEVASSFYNLAEFYRLRGNYKSAGQYYQQLLEIRGKLPEGVRHAYGDVKIRYACALRKDGNPEQAEKVEADDAEAPRSNEANKGDSEVINGKALSLPKPGYPSEARGARASGTVAVQVLIDETGKVTFACAVSGPPLLQLASEQAALGARFSPTLFQGVPVKVTGVITYNFVAQ
jgi:TonB family protein